MMTGDVKSCCAKSDTDPAMKIKLDQKTAAELVQMTTGGVTIPSRKILSEIGIPNLIITNDEAGNVFITTSDAQPGVGLVKVTPDERQEIAAAILSAAIANADQADLAPSAEDGGFEKTLLVLNKLPETRQYNIGALHYVLMTDVSDDMLSMAAGRPVGRALNALATLVL